MISKHCNTYLDCWLPYACYWQRFDNAQTTKFQSHHSGVTKTESVADREGKIEQYLVQNYHVSMSF